MLLTYLVTKRAATVVPFSMAKTPLTGPVFYDQVREPETCLGLGQPGDETGRPLKALLALLTGISPSTVARWVLPVPLLPIRIRFSLLFRYSP